MVRKAEAVFPRLVEMGLYRKKIAGDGNCLFASLSDQLYNTPAKHPEIRQAVVDYMRANRQAFENYVSDDSLEMRRPMRETTRAQRERDETVDDKYEGYLKKMATNGVYGGHAEIVAFSRALDRDVIIHRPLDKEQGFQKIENNVRAAGEVPQTVHVTYGDEKTRAHYDSVRQVNPPQHVHPPQASQAPPATQPPSEPQALQATHPPQPPFRRRSPTLSIEGELVHIQVLQRVLPTIPPEEIKKFIEKGKKDLDASFQQLIFGGRARSSSRSSSQRSSSSKRSLDDDGDVHRAPKRPNTRTSLRSRDQDRSRAVALVSSMEQGTEVSFRILVDSPDPETPGSTHDTESPPSSPAPNSCNKGSPDTSPSPKNDLDTSPSPPANLTKDVADSSVPPLGANKDPEKDSQESTPASSF